MRHIDSFKKIRDLLWDIQCEFIAEASKNPNSVVNMMDQTHPAIVMIQDAIKECSSFIPKEEV